MSNTIRITVAEGDGIGPEIMESVLAILQSAGAPLEFDRVELGQRAYLKGHPTGIPAAAWEVIRRNKVMLKSPITTPQGGGYKSVNVTLRNTLGLFANVRLCKAYTPYVQSPYPGMNLVIIRENEEDLYAGIEHQQTREVTQALKLITLPGSEKIIRYAFEYTRAYGRKKVTCMTKDNIMKITDGLFHKTFDRVAREYPDVRADHQIIDIGAARVAAQPTSLDVIVTPNLYGDILSDIAAQVAGSVGLAGSANIGWESAMFEAVHGSAPDIAGKDIANPSGLLVAAVEMLVHIGQPEIAQRIKNAWLVTLEDGIHTADIYRSGLSQRAVGTRAFTQAVIDRLGRVPEQLEPVSYHGTGIHFTLSLLPPAQKELVGVDVFLDWSASHRDPLALAKQLEVVQEASLPLQWITNRGVKMYPDPVAGAYATDHWRCRFLSANGRIDYAQVLSLLQRIHAVPLEVIKTENLYTFDGEAGFSSGQGE